MRLSDYARAYGGKSFAVYATRFNDTNGLALREILPHAGRLAVYFGRDTDRIIDILLREWGVSASKDLNALKNADFLLTFGTEPPPFSAKDLHLTIDNFGKIRYNLL